MVYAGDSSCTAEVGDCQSNQATNRASSWVSRMLRVSGAVLLVAALTLADVQPARAQDDPTRAPATVVSGDGRSVTDGRRTLSTSQAADLQESQRVTVNGSGYDETKGVYVALCVVPATNYVPSPCGGGEDRSGASGASGWVSSNPPSYAQGLTQPYGAGGTFTTSLDLSPVIGTFDCREVRCAIVTRNDHTLSTDRSQDLFIPVSFQSAAGEPAPTTTPPEDTTPETLPPTTAPPATVLPGASVVAADGNSVTDQTRTLRVATAKDLDPTQVSVAVSGTGYDATKGVFVALCAVGVDGNSPGPCLSGSSGATAWISSNPPDYGVGLVTPYGDGGSFAVELQVGAVIDGVTDCRVVACAITTRPDDTQTLDRSQELVIPVSFAATSGEAVVAEVEDQDDGAADIDDDGGSSLPVVPVAVAVVALVAVAALLVRRRAALMPTADNGPS